jgi:hypothetical protein
MILVTALITLAEDSDALTAALTSNSIVDLRNGLFISNSCILFLLNIHIMRTRFFRHILSVRTAHKIW